MRRLPPELFWSLLVIVVLGGLYGFMARGGLPRPGGLLGHGLGIVGFLMMLAAETLYTLRKRLRGWNYGPLSTWLQVHVFTGIVGPFLVLLHTAGKYQGLAGVVTLLMVLLVLSGFIGRFIYTAVPRTAAGTEVDSRELLEQWADLDRQLREAQWDPERRLAGKAAPAGWLVVLGRPWLRWRFARRIRPMVWKEYPHDRARARHVCRLLERRHSLQLQIYSLGTSRKILAIWHILHVPLGGVLFSLAFIHIGAALYYSTFLR